MPDRTVFVVDDDAGVRQGLRFMLRAAGYSVEGFASAHAFLEGYDPRQGGCLLLDVQMPNMTGPESQQHLNLRGWRIPVTFIAGHGSVLLAIAPMKAGAFDSSKRRCARMLCSRASTEPCIGMTGDRQRKVQWPFQKF
ncbi:MAG: response regulator [Alphaproteobacteria bacterium]|nr:response regulator [Alphaproteobacteria bacterium]